MNFFNDIFRNKQHDTVVQKLVSAKEKQLIFIKNELKPLLKEQGYSTSGNSWWKITEPFFNLIQLQNFSWNSKDCVDFTFNFTTGFVRDIKNIKKPSIHDGLTYIREQQFGVSATDYGRNQNGYHIEQITDAAKFSYQALTHFRIVILPKFNQLDSIEEIEKFYVNEFWSPRVRHSLKLGYKNLFIEDSK